MIYYDIIWIYDYINVITMHFSWSEVDYVDVRNMFQSECWEKLWQELEKGLTVEKHIKKGHLFKNSKVLSNKLSHKY